MKLIQQHDLDTARKLADDPNLDPLVVWVRFRLYHFAAWLEQDEQQAKPMSPVESYKRQIQEATQIVDTIKQELAKNAK